MRRLLLVLGLLSVAPAVAGAQKTDTLWLARGDRLVGEIKRMQRAQVEYSTDDMSTVYVQWDKVLRLVSRTNLDVELRNGDRYFGALVPGPARHLVVSGFRIDTLPMDQVAEITPLKKTFWSRLNGYLDLGFNFQKASDIVQLTTDGQVRYRGEKTESQVSWSFFFQDQDSSSTTSRASGGVVERIFLTRRWNAGGAIGLETNDELDLNLRTTFSGFGERIIATNNHIDFNGGVGLVVTREDYAGNPEVQTNVELAFLADFAAFRYVQPKLDAGVTATVRPSLTTAGRIRVDLDARLGYEVIKDFMVNLSYFQRYDSKPPSVDAPKNDLGTTLSLR